MLESSGKQKTLRAAALIAFCACAAGALYLFRLSGANVKTALCVWGAAIIAVFLPGAALASWLAPKESGALRAALAVTLGSLGFALATVLASATGVHALCWLWPAAGMALALWLLWKRRGERQTEKTAFCTDRDWNVLLCLGGFFALLGAFSAQHSAHPAAAGVLIPQQDFYWNLGNVQSFFYGFPPEDLRVSGVTITYHYLTELFEAGLCFLTGAPAYDVTAFYAYAPLAALMLCGLYALGRRLWDTEKTEESRLHLRALLLAAMPLWLCDASLWKALSGASRFGNSLFSAVASNLNGQVTALAFLAAFFVLFDAFIKAAMQTEKQDTRRLLAPLCAAAAAFYLLTFSKGPEAGLLACALACALLILSMRHGAKRGWLAAAALTLCAGFAVLYVCYFSAGASSSMHLSWTGTLSENYFASILAALTIRFPSVWGVFVPVLMLLQAFLMAPLAFFAWVCCALRDVKKLSSLSALRLVCHACVVGGFTAYFIFDHYSSSQVYFAYIALIAEAILLLDGCVKKKDGLREKIASLAGAALAAVQVLTAVCLTVAAVKGGWAILHTPLAESSRVPLTAAEETGCRWLAENMTDSELFATNRMHNSTAEEGLSNVYTGLSGRHAYMESFKYAVSNMGEGAGDVMARYDLVNSLFSPDTTPETVQSLCRENGIAYLVYCPAESGSDESLAGFEAVYISEEMTIYRVG